MAKRIIVSTVITLALAFSPSLAFSLPTKNVNKKKPSSSNAQKEESRKSKSAKKSSYSSSRHSRHDDGEVVESSMVPHSGGSVYETPPLMKVTPQRDGGFLLEPLEPKKNGSALNKPSSNTEVTRDQSSLRRGSTNTTGLSPGISRI